MLKKPAFMMTCKVCGAEVRNDVISRHMQTSKCKQGAVSRHYALAGALASPSSEARPPASGMSSEAGLQLVTSGLSWEEGPQLLGLQ